ncbi:MAG: T9SS type A sorting domain-containing protein, partial [Candidatus Omnitrophica bacterium]|nr:T9SS type A sorting domain-containing protein [Candidatus Omnitrophota bacterium]
ALYGGDYTFTFTTSPPDTLPPTIGPVYLNNRLFVWGSENGMASAPTIKALITDEGGSGINPGAFLIRIDGRDFTPEAGCYSPTTQYLIYSVPESERFDVGSYVLTIEASDFDNNRSTWEGKVIVRRGPIIDQVKFDGRPYVKGDIISRSPSITARITVEAGNSVEASSIRLIIGPYNIVGVASYTPSQATMVCSLKPTIQLGPASYTVSIEAADIYGTKGYWTGYDIKVLNGEIQVIGPVLTYPAPFKPLRGGNARFVYTLSRDAEITMLLYDISGSVVLTRKFKSGVNGGRAGYNEVEWDGKTDFGNVIGNGIYMYRITSGNKVIGTGKLVVLD